MRTDDVALHGDASLAATNGSRPSKIKAKRKTKEKRRYEISSDYSSIVDLDIMQEDD